MRKRLIFTIYMIVVVFGLLILTDPDLGLVQKVGIGAGTITSLVYLLKGMLGILLVQLARKSIFDYPTASFQFLSKIAKESPVGAGLYAIAISVAMVAFAIALVGTAGI